MEDTSRFRLVTQMAVSTLLSHLGPETLSSLLFPASVCETSRKANSSQVRPVQRLLVGLDEVDPNRRQGLSWAALIRLASTPSQTPRWESAEKQARFVATLASIWHREEELDSALRLVELETNSVALHPLPSPRGSDESTTETSTA